MNKPTRPVELQVLLPVYNEAPSIEQTLREMHGVVATIAPMEFLICEDGSADGTKEILRRLAGELPLRLIQGDALKGYSRAVRDGMLAANAPYLLSMDSDGQCDPSDVQAFWELRRPDGVVVGWRKQRADSRLRRMLSRIFFSVYRLVIPVPIHDPSCPFVLAGREVVAQLVGEMGSMREGYWWEFAARVYLHRIPIVEVPIRHRIRTAGVTKVYRFRKMPEVFLRHLVALFQIRWQARKYQ
jgi:dolichol-phosphate mannosyltransferase